MKKKKFEPLNVIYVASPYTYKTKIPFLRRIVEWYRFLKVTYIVSKLENLYRAAYIMPITMSHLTQTMTPTLGGEFSSWADVDYTYMTKCDMVIVIATMNGWKESIGVKAEIAFAKKKKIPVFYLKSIENDKLVLTPVPPQ